MYLIRNDDFCRIKVAKFLSTKKHQSLRIKLVISSLKSHVVRVCCNQSHFKYSKKPLLNFLQKENRSTKFTNF